MIQQLKIRYPLDEGFLLIGINRTKGYQLIAAGELATTKDGKRRYVSHKALLDYVQRKELEADGGRN